MKVDITKFDRQALSAQRWKENNGIGCLNLVPRFGKTYLSLHFIGDPHLKYDKDNDIIIIVPSDIIAKHWEANLKAYSNYTDRYRIYSIHYIERNDIDLECTLLIIDEIHKMITDSRISALMEIRHKYLLALTGTYPFGNKKVEDLFPIVDTITEDEAVENGWISPFEEYNIVLKLTKADQRKYILHSKPITETLGLFRGASDLLLRPEKTKLLPSDFDVIKACYSGFNTMNLHGYPVYIKNYEIAQVLSKAKGWHVNMNLTIDNNQQLHDLWSPVAIQDRAKNFMNSIRRRNEILINNPIKLQMVGNIIEYSKLPTICFNESTEFADTITQYINMRFGYSVRAMCYHSKISTRSLIDPSTNNPYPYKTGKRKGHPKLFGKTALKKMTIDGFKLGVYKFISTAKALDEGVDLPNLEQVICTAGTTNPMTYQQRTARGKTVDIYNPNKVTQIFNLVFDDFIDEDTDTIVKSRDKQKLILRQRESGHSVNWIEDISDIIEKNTP